MKGIAPHLTHLRPDHVRPGQGDSTLADVTSFERARRNQAIVNARLRGIGERRVAEMYGVTERHVRRVLQEYRASRPALHDLDPAVALTDASSVSALLDEAITLADEAKHESVRLGALKLRLNLLDGRLRLIPGIGLVPSEVERARMMAEWSQIARQMSTCLTGTVCPRTPAGDHRHGRGATMCRVGASGRRRGGQDPKRPSGSFAEPRARRAA